MLEKTWASKMRDPKMDLKYIINDLKYKQSEEITCPFTIDYPLIDELDTKIGILERFIKKKEEGKIMENDYISAATVICYEYIPNEHIDFEKTVCDNCDYRKNICANAVKSNIADKLVL